MTYVTVSPTTKNATDTIILTGNKEGKIILNDTSIQKKPVRFTAYNNCIN